MTELSEAPHEQRRAARVAGPPGAGPAGPIRPVTAQAGRLWLSRALASRARPNQDRLSPGFRPPSPARPP